MASENPPNLRTLEGLVNLFAWDTDLDQFVPVLVVDNALKVFSTNGVDHIDAPNGVAVVEQGQFDYEPVAASQTDHVLGNTGALGDFLHRLILVVATAASAATSIKDGTGPAISVLPNSPGGGIGVYQIEFNMVSTNGAWQVTTGAGVSVIGVGRFTA